MNHRRPGRRRARPAALAAACVAVLAAGYAAVPLLGAVAAAADDDHHPAAMGLLFADEFDGTALDRGRWCTRYQFGGGAALQSGYQDAACAKDGGGTLDFLNDEKQRYRDVNSRGAALHVVKDGVLSLTATRTGSGAAPYESAMIRSKLELRPEGSTGYYLTSRVRLPDVLGSWPAFWLTPGMRNGSAQWPPELDIFEGALNGDGDNANMLHMASHGTKAAGGATFDAANFDTTWGNLQQPGSIRGQWHEVGFEWTASSACWFFDGTKVHCEAYRWVDDSGAAANPSPILLNLAVGGAWAGRGGIEDAKFPMSLDVDHVRVYSSAVAPGATSDATKAPTSAATGPTTPTSTAPGGGSGGTAPDGAVLLRSAASGLCLAPGRVGRAATIQPCTEQRWTATPAGELRSGGRCLDAMGAATRNGTPVALWGCNGGANQRWTRHGDGTWTGAQSGKCLDVEGQHTAAGTTIQLWTCNGQANQRWTSVGTGSGSGTQTPAVTPSAPVTSTPGTSAPSTGGRRFLLGLFTAGSEITSYRDYLGYHPEVTYDSSYQDDHHKTCGQPVSGLDELNGYPVMVSVFTVNGDFAGSARGAYDSCYEKLFAGLAAKAGSIYGVRVDVEFWPHPAAADFTRSFDRIVAIAKKHLPARVKYLFNPNWDSGLGAGYVPASADVIGPDAYNNPQWCQGRTSAQCAADKFDPARPGSIAYWTKIAQQLGKPMALPEWGDDYGDGVYVDKVADWAYDVTPVTPGKSNDVVYLGYWDSNYTEDAHLRGTARTVFQKRFAGIPYTGTFWGSLLPTTAHGRF